MGDTIYKLAGDKKVKRKPIEDAINEILKLDDEKIRSIGDLYLPFKMLTTASNKARLQKKSVLEFLTDDNLLYIIAKFKQSLPMVSKNIEKMEEAVKDIEQLKTQKETIEKRMGVISQIKPEEPTIIPKEPGTWAVFITDKNPGFLKSIFLFFVPQASINEAQKICEDHDEYLRVTDKIEALTSENNRLQERLDSKEIEIQQKEQMKSELEELKGHKTILENNVEILENNANSITSVEARHEVEQTIAKERIQDEDMQFSMDL